MHDATVSAPPGAPRGRQIWTWLVLLALAAAGWAITAIQARGMASMNGMAGMAAEPSPALLFLPVWVGMMVAMMFPSVVPVALLAPFIGEMMGVDVVPIQYQDDGRRHRVKIGGATEVEIEDFVPPGSPTKEVEKITGVFHPANSTLTVARATRSHVKAFGLVFSTVGKNGHSAPFAWAG